jgi:flagellar biosynthesis/type III secretory pathway chaperone
MSVQRSDIHRHLTRILAEERRLLGELESVLQRETEILRGDDAQAIERIGDSRHGYIDTLSKLDAERADTCRMLSFGAGPDALAQLYQWADPGEGLRQDWNVNLELARRCKALNDRNGAIVIAKLGRVQQLLGKLRGTSLAPVYSARGSRYGGLGARDLGCA